MTHCHQQKHLPLGRDEYRPSTFVILLSFSNLAVSEQNFRPRPSARITEYPAERKAPAVGGHCKAWTRSNEMTPI